MVDQALSDDPDGWRTTHTCIPCTNKLPDEPKMIFSMQIAIDGNNSLKRVQRVRKETAKNGEVVSILSHEREDSRQVIDGHMVTVKEVDKYKDEVQSRQVSCLLDLPKLTTNTCYKGY
jgi:hypothetical protein